MLAFFQCPCASRNSAAAVIDNFEHAQFFYFIREPRPDIRTALHDLFIALPSQADKVVILRYHLPAGTGEIQRECRSVSAQVFHPEDQLPRQVAEFTPDRPAASQWRKTKFVS